MGAGFLGLWHEDVTLAPKVNTDTCVSLLSGYWNVTVYGRKHCYRLYTKLLNEATRWSSAIQNVTDTKAPIDTPTQQLIQDIKVGVAIVVCGSPQSPTLRTPGRQH